MVIPPKSLPRSRQQGLRSIHPGRPQAGGQEVADQTSYDLAAIAQRGPGLLALQEMLDFRQGFIHAEKDDQYFTINPDPNRSEKEKRKAGQNLRAPPRT